MKLSNESGFRWIFRKARHAGSRVEREEGSTLLEFAMVALVLLVLLIGIIYGGIMAYDRVVLTNAVATGVRTLATEMGDSAACTDANTALTNAAYGLNTSSSVLTIANPPVFLSATGSGSGTSSCPPGILVGGEYAVMWATYPCSMYFPKLGINLCSTSQATTSITYPPGPTCSSLQAQSTGCVETVTISLSCPTVYCFYAIDSAAISGTG